MKLRTIQNIYDELNRKNFAGRMERPTILLSRAWSSEGSYVNAGGNTQRSYMGFGVDWHNGIKEMRATVFHEMIHQYIYEILKLDGSEHNDLFWFCYFLYATPDFPWENSEDYKDEITH